MTPRFTAALLTMAAPVLLACPPVETAGTRAAAHPEARPFDADFDAGVEFETALLEARLNDRLTLAVFGANWCHDSRALAGWLETDRFRALTDAHYEVIYIDVATPQNGEGRNLELAEMSGVEDITGTPTLLIFGSDSSLLNADTAKSWRNAASRSEDEIYAELARYPDQLADE